MPDSERDSVDHPRATARPAAAPSSTATADPVAGDELDSRTLFALSRRRVIVHQGERYCLQLTRAGKLLLTK